VSRARAAAFRNPVLDAALGRVDTGSAALGGFSLRRAGSSAALITSAEERTMASFHDMGLIDGIIQPSTAGSPAS
jgi:hypothetical protein